MPVSIVVSMAVPLGLFFICLLLNWKEFSFKIVFRISLAVVLRNETSSALGIRL